ncbi:TadE/TadG family type IV pilus assembly protein [Aestuariivita boseongensis]|uniref:TadE/TadG family type IV pilus assembly protein n=1 Tax=Aestuariivita boseongensis TaxID=1470562 RepID=UPI00316AD370
MRFLTKPFRGFFRKEDGNATIEFAILFVPMFSTLMWAVELGMIHINHSMLERAVDSTVRDLRLGTGTAPQHAQIRDMICDRAMFIDDCSTTVRLEMIRIDPFNWQNPPTDIDCIDATQPIEPVRSFVNGASNELMFLRVCAKYDPILPHIGLSQSLDLDGNLMFPLVATAAFVQEPS